MGSVHGIESNLPPFQDFIRESSTRNLVSPSGFSLDSLVNSEIQNHHKVHQDLFPRTANLKDFYVAALGSLHYVPDSLKGLYIPGAAGCLPSTVAMNSARVVFSFCFDFSAIPVKAFVLLWLEMIETSRACAWSPHWNQAPISEMLLMFDVISYNAS